MINVDLSHLKRNNLKKSDKSKGNNLLPTKKENVIGNELLPSKIEVSFELSENQELNSYLILKSQELLGVQLNARLHLGRIFQDVFDKLAGSPHNGLYVQWLGINGFNKMTALRHRNRYKIYNEMKLDHSKYLIATASQKIIDILLTHPEKKSILEMIESNITKEELNTLVLGEKIIPIEKEFNFDLETEYNSFKKKYNKINISKLSNKQKEKFSKLLESFDRLFEEIK